MKRIKSIISSDSDDDVIDLSKNDDEPKFVKKDSKSSFIKKGSKKVKSDRNQMSIEASFGKSLTTKRKAEENSYAGIGKIPKLNKNKAITDDFLSTKNIILSNKVVASTSNSAEGDKNKIKMTPIKEKSLSNDKETVSESVIATMPSHKKPTKSTKSNATIISSPVNKSKEAYVKFLHRSGPSAVGSKKIPEGKPNCLSGLTFVITGVLNSIERDDAQTLIERYGGKVTKAVSGKTSYLVVGDQPGNSKIEKAIKLKTKQINEDQLFNLIGNSPVKLSTTPNDASTSQMTKKSKGSSHIPKKKIPSQMETMAHISSSKPSGSSTHTLVNTSDNQKARSEKSEHPIALGGMLLVDKYSPKSLSQIVGQQGDRSPANKLLSWLQHFEENRQSDSKSDEDGARFRAVLLSGPPGIGKTTTARLVCKQLGYDVLEFNASSVRSKKSLQDSLAESLTMRSFYKKEGVRHCVIMDEVDGMAGNEDRGGINELIQLIKITQHPIICICNDRQSRKLQSFVRSVYDLRYRQLTVDQMRAAIVPIIRSEKIIISDHVIQDVIKSTNYDMRQVLNNLQMWPVGGRDSDTLKCEAQNASKEFKLGPFDVVQKVFSHDSLKTMSDKSDLFFYDYQLAPLFVQENYPLVRPYLAKGDACKTLKLMSLAADSMAMGDIVSAKIRSSNNWNLLPTQAMLSSVIPGEYLHGRLTARIEFPGWLGKFSKQNKNRRILSTVCAHFGLSCRSGWVNPSAVAMDCGDLMVQRLCGPLREGDVETAMATLHRMELRKEDMDLLCEATAWSHVPNQLSRISAQIKSMFTRACNRASVKMPYATVSVKKSQKMSESLFEGEEEEEAEEEEKEDEELGSDVMIVKMEDKQRKVEPGKKQNDKKVGKTTKVINKKRK